MRSLILYGKAGFAKAMSTWAKEITFQDITGFDQPEDLEKFLESQSGDDEVVLLYGGLMGSDPQLLLAASQCAPKVLLVYNASLASVIAASQFLLARDSLQELENSIQAESDAALKSLIV